MKPILLGGLILLLPVAAAADDSTGVQLTLSYNGTGQFTFEKNNYNYTALLQAIRAEYGTRHITSVTVDMGDDSNIQDRLKICHLKLDTGALVMLTFKTDGQQSNIYCS